MGLLSFEPLNGNFASSRSSKPRGLLGLGGFGDWPSSGLLAQDFEPDELRNQKFKQMLLGASMGLLSQGPSSTPIGFGDTLAAGMKGGLQGAQQAEQDYRQNRLFAADYQNKQQDRSYQQSERDRVAQERADKKAHVVEFLRGLPPEDLKFAEMDPEGFAKKYWDKLHPDASPQAPKVETLYDDNGGTYKGQYNYTTGQWDKIGGTKQPDNGIEITNADGSTTRIGGTGNKSTESDKRAQALTQQIVGQEQSVMQGFSTLATPQNYIGSNVPGGSVVMTEQAQIAKDSITNVVANWLYLTSGATATDAEIERQTDMVTPSPLDKPGRVAAKKARLQSIFDTMKTRGGMTTQQRPLAQPGGKTQSGIEWSVEP